MMGYHTLKKYDAVLYAVSIQYRYVTDRRTDNIAHDKNVQPTELDFNRIDRNVSQKFQRLFKT